MPTKNELIALNQWSKNIKDNILPDNYKYIGTEEVESVGYKCSIVQERGTDNYVFVHDSGYAVGEFMQVFLSEFFEKHDDPRDYDTPEKFTELFQDEYSKYSLAKGVDEQANYADNIRIAFKNSHPEANITHTGEGIGGGHSEYVAAKSGDNAVTFNPIGASSQCAKNGIDINQNYYKITNHINDGSTSSITSLPIGNNIIYESSTFTKVNILIQTYAVPKGVNPFLVFIIKQLLNQYDNRKINDLNQFKNDNNIIPDGKFSFHRAHWSQLMIENPNSLPKDVRDDLNNNSYDGSLVKLDKSTFKKVLTIDKDKKSNNQVIKSKIAFDAANGNEVSQNVFKETSQQTSTPDTPDEIIMPNHVPAGADLSNIVDRALAVTEMNSNTFVNYASFDFDIDISLDINQSYISSLNTSASIVKLTYPLVLDLEGNGIETISLSDSNAYFDLDGDGFAEKVGWLSKNDATLVIDKNNNGIIEGMGEVFGGINPDTAGFTELKFLDSNNDDIIDVKDAQFNELQIWQDLNEDAITDAGELKTLQQANIESINLNYGEMHQDNNSNYIAYASTYTTTGGQVRLIGDAFYVYDKTQSFYDNDYVFNADSIHLPWLKGYGVVKDLQLVLPTNTALLNLVTNLTTQTNPQTVYNGFDEVLERWGGINTTLSTNEKKRLLLNKFIGENVQSVSSENQGYLDLSYRILKNKYFTEFISYTSIGIDYGITHDFVSDSISIDENIFYDAIVDNFTDRNDYLSSFAILESVEASGELNFDKLNNSISDSNNGSILMEYLFNSNKNFMFASALSTNGTVGSDLIIGMTGNDTITGGDGNDVIIAEDGNDSITDTAGNDTYLFNLGNGSDTITDSDGNDVFKFGQNINVEDVIFTQNNNDMEVSIKNTTDKVTIKNWYTDDKNKIETFAFASGDAIFSNNLDVVTNSGQPIADLTKDDTYLLNSSTNNNIWDFNGNDTYIYNLGSGKIAFEDTYTDYGDQDIIYWLFGKTDNSKISDSKYTDELRFGAGINKEDVTFVKVGKNLEIQVNEQDSVTVKNWFHAHREKLGSLWDFHLYRNKMEFITFADGSYLHKSEITDYVNSTDISPNTYTLANNNSIADPGGDDTYIFNKNIGSATITESHGVDSLQFDVGIALADMEFIRIDKDLIIESSVNSDKLTVKDWYRSANKQIETIKFSDTTLTNKDIYDMPITIYGTDNIDEDLTDGISNVEELVGNNNDNIIYGLDGDDKIFDFKGDDTINAGKGADTLADYDGNDTYIYKSGDGKLIIYDYVGEDTIKFEGLTLNNLDISRNKDDLEIAVSSGGKITVKNCYSNTNNFIENIQFGTTVYQTDDKINNLIADSAGNILVANALNNNLNGNESADYMYAKATLCKARQ